jgi:hypothetical protein
MQCRIDDGVVSDEGLPKNRAATSSYFDGWPTIGFTILGGLGKATNLAMTLDPAKSGSLAVRAIESAQLGYGKLVTSVLE